MRWAVPVLIVLAVLPFVVPPYQTVLLSYGLVFAIAALGFNLLLGYTGLLSFGHSAYFGVGAYAVAFVVKYLKIQSMEVFILGGDPRLRPRGRAVRPLVRPLHADLLRHPDPGAVAGPVEPRLQVLLGHRGFGRPPRPDADPARRHPHDGRDRGQDKLDFLSHRYYYYVLVVFVVCVAVMWVIVHSPFGKALQAIRDNETRRSSSGVQVWHYRWVAFLISGIYTGLAGALWVPLNGLTTPDILHWTFSGQDRVLHGARRVSDVLRPHRRRGPSSTTSRPMPSATPCTGRWSSASCSSSWCSRCPRASSARRSGSSPASGGPRRREPPARHPDHGAARQVLRRDPCGRPRGLPGGGG